MRCARALGVCRLHPFLQVYCCVATPVCHPFGRRLSDEKALPATWRPTPSADDIGAECERFQRLPQVEGYELLRIYYYDAAPSSEKLTFPVSRADYNLASTDRYRESQRLFGQLILKPQFALRMGEVRLSPDKWRVKPRSARQLVREARALTG